MLYCDRPLVLKERDFNPFTQSYRQVVPCGKCLFCLKRRALAWCFRLEKELENAESGVFLTMTYEDNHLPYTKQGLTTLDSSDPVKFMKRIRKNYDIHPRFPLKYYTVGEYGEKYARPHYHSLVFNLPDDLQKQEWNEEKQVWIYKNLQDTWKKGHVHVKPITAGRIHYVTGYLQKSELYNDKEKRGYYKPGLSDKYKRKYYPDGRQKEKSLMSKGLGQAYLSDDMIEYYQTHLLPYVIKEGGHKQVMPRYYKERIYTEKQLELIAQESATHLGMTDPLENFDNIKHWRDYVTACYDKRNKKKSQSDSNF